MQTLENLKRRLLALPGLREGRQHEARYAAFLAKTLPAKDRLVAASLAATHASTILPPTSFRETRRAIRTSATIASRLKQKLDSEPAAVAEDTIEQSFTRLFEKAESAQKTCHTTWEEGLQAKIQDWEAIADVVARLVPREGSRLQRATNSLRAAKLSPPQSGKAAKEVQEHLDNLKDALSKLGLETAFGKFLQAAASTEGADLSAARTDEVSKMIKQHDLEKVFRIRLSS